MKLWGGRFSADTNEAAHHFHSSVTFDSRLYKQDILGSIAHAEMLGRQGIIPKADAESIVVALGEILSDIENGVLGLAAANAAAGVAAGAAGATSANAAATSANAAAATSAEDIHSFIENELVSRIGDAGRRLHTGRSRNDQVALDMRMYVKDEINAVCTLITDLLKTLLKTAKKHTKTIMPGYTHMQKAQPITLAHHLLAYFQMFRRDYQRLRDCFERTDEMPLGSGALAATTYPLDREYVRKKLGFARLTANSLDAVSDRDFCVELGACLSIVMMHLSRFCEEIILWSTDAFDFIEISDSFSTGSSIMPQKKNPDMAELIRGKTGRVYGSLTALLTVMKGLPLAYNKDMQEDKEAVFDAADTVKACLSVFVGMLEGLTFKTDKMYQSALGGYTNATDAADWLVKKGVSFREAHELVGRLVLYAIEKNVPLDRLSLSELTAVSEVFDESLFEAISVENCVDARSIIGGPAESAVLQAIEDCEEFLRG